ncbi:Mss4-like protein [Naematelia encephala]|uniref:Mss4-like protein n=1 Tax=Naematelia encephala TaxID=71784 RepID=A0A1Y2AWN6_9TREE|nr:Mss4-like protein [Naematelia encephala]
MSKSDTMGTAATITGQCLCGAVTMSMPIPTSEATQICHCIDCRKSTGCLAIPLIRVPLTSFHYQGEISTYYAPGLSGASVGRVFCLICGSQLWDTSSVETDKIWIKGGLFPPGSIPIPTLEIFAKDMEAWEIPIPGAHLVQIQ